MGPKDCTETSVNNYQRTLCNDSEEQTCLHREGNLANMLFLNYEEGSFETAPHAKTGDRKNFKSKKCKLSTFAFLH
jgi:hypothetical protein